MRTETSRTALALLFTAMAFLLGAQNASGATVIVTRTDDRNMTCLSNLDCSLREAVLAAAPNDTIIFSASVFNVPRVITLVGTGVSIFKNVNIVGPGADLLTLRIFDPSQYEVLNVNGVGLVVSLSGMKLTDGTHGLHIGFSNVVVNLDKMAIDGNAGGGIFAAGVVMNISNSSISNNPGGGINCNNEATITLVNSTVSGNASDRGAGIINFSTLKLINTTITNNTASIESGGIRNHGTVSVLNSIVAGNQAPTAPDASGTFSSHGNNLIGNTSGNSGWTAADKTNQSANLAPLATNGGITRNHLPNAGSVAINAGNNCVTNNTCSLQLFQPLSFDQRGAGFPRQIGNAVDIGAVERNAPTVAGISGRVLTQSGRGVGGAFLMLTNSGGETRFAITNPFGYYRFVGVPTGANYNLAVSSKRFSFSARSVDLSEDITEFNFVANN